MGAMAQKERVRNQPYADLKWLHLGFHVGIHSQDLLLTHTGVMTNGETWFAEIPSYSPGFSVGVIGDMYMNPYFNLRFTPSIHFGDKKGNPILLKSTDFGFEFGLGCDIYLPYFKLCPELKFCFGLVNLLEKDRPDLVDQANIKYTDALSKATSRMVILTFNFE